MGGRETNQRTITVVQADTDEVRDLKGVCSLPSPMQIIVYSLRASPGAQRGATETCSGSHS